MIAETHVAGSRRRLMFHDGLTFLGLLAASLALFAVTLLLFRSFEQRRADLSRMWTERGRVALEQGHAADAVIALRTALTYTDAGPDSTADQLLLARALADSGHLDEARSYFLNLWEAHPGDGEVNLDLARIARQQGRYDDAAEYYRISIDGSWESEGMVRRRAVRMEFSDYLASRGQDAEARDELITVAGNAASDRSVLLDVGGRFEAAGDLPDALSFYQRAARLRPRDPVSSAREKKVADELAAVSQAAAAQDEGGPDGK